MANNSISLVSLDFDTLKTQLKTYLKAQPQFTDYDFDGSNMSVLLDLLAYNTHLNAFYLNMVASEMFLDSAQLRNSVISIAKSLNYLPRSSKSARATVDMVFPQSGLSSFTIPESARFTGRNSNGTFSFVTGESIVLYPNDGVFTANSVELFEGSATQDSFVINYAVEGQRLVLSNPSIDTDSLRVTVIEDDGITNTVFNSATVLFDVQPTSNVYFLQAAEDSKYELVFGDDVFGRRPKDGSIVVAQYRVTSADRGNGATSFLLVDNLGAYNGYGQAISPTITTLQAGVGGSLAETIEEIRYRAPRHFQAQERAITVSDFSTLIEQEFQTVKSVYVYGGETLTSPQYGRVFISPATFSGEPLTNIEKRDIEDFVKARCTLGTIPIVVDPDYLYLEVKTSVLYRQDTTTKTPRDIQTAVKNAIVAFNDSELGTFNTVFRQSKFEGAIDAADVAVYSNDTEVLLKKFARVELNSRVAASINFHNPLQPGTITSASFISGGRIYQYTDFNPNINTFVLSQANGETVVQNKVNTLYIKDITVPGAVSYATGGSIDYENGIVNLSAIAVTDLFGSTGIGIYAKAPYGNITSRENDVLVIDIAELAIDVERV